MTGRPPFEKSSEAAVLFAHISEPPAAPSSLRRQLPQEVDSVLAKGLAKPPGERYASASELIAAAGRAFEEPAPVQPPQAERTKRPPRQKRPKPTKRPKPRRAAPPPRRLPRPPVALAAVGALSALALAFGLLSSDGSPPVRDLAAAGDLAVTVPPGWSAVRGGDVPGLPLTGASTLRPRAGDDEQSVVVGMSAAGGKALLPPDLARVAVGAARGQPVRLGSLQALRYLGLQPPESSAPPLTVFVAPVSSGVATVACSPSRRVDGLVRECAQIAASLTLREGRGYPLGPSPRLSVVLRRVLGQLNDERQTLRRRLGKAGSADRQASSASSLAAAFRAATRNLAGRRVTPQSAPALARLVAALRGARDAYEDLAAAARREDDPAYRAAANAVGAAEATVDRRVRDLRSLGYAVEGGD